MKYPERIFVTSDQHFGHANIIKYCNRPFRDIDEMNSVMLNSWNNMIRPHDNVYFLGDLVYGKSSGMDYWRRKLNGRIRFIRGNHDESNHIPFIEAATLVTDDISFLLIHDPDKVPSEWSGWVIHGHWHNNVSEEMIDFDNKRVNVSVEVTNYKPVDMRTITNRISRKDRSE